ncbi:MAG: hypothetical protein AAF623_03275 [Planctomycetota bacterium]
MGIFTFQLPAICDELVTEKAIDEFTIGSPNQSAKQILNGLDSSDLFESPIKDKRMAKCCLSGVWLLHHFLYESHEISQEIPTSEGSYWHGIMHRMERDYWNSKYWYRQVGDHTVYRSVGDDWDPHLFVDQCEEAEANGDLASVQPIAATEWKCLFEYCYLNAT